MRYLFLLLLGIVGYASLSFAHSLSAPPKSIKRHLSQLIAAAGDDFNIGIMIFDLDNQKLLYQKNRHRFFHLASNIKLFTAYAALKQLGRDYQYDTELLMDPVDINNNILSGNIYLRFTGDPKLTTEHLTLLLKKLTEKGIKKIDGKIIIDNTRFDNDSWPPGTGHDDSMFGYGALVDSINIDDNTITAKLIPTENGQVAKIEYDARRYPVQIINQVITQQSEQCEPELQVDVNNHYYLTGCIHKATELKLAVQSMPLYITAVISNILRSLNISVTQDITFDIVAQPARLIAVHQSLPLLELVRQMLKESDNLVGNALFKTLAAQHGQIPASWKTGSQAMQNSFKELMPDDSYRIVDGDGRSPYNLVKPQQVLTLLRKVYSEPTLKQDFFYSLPIGGKDGTLQDRFRDKKYQGRVYAKTGSAQLSGWSSLSGYLITRSHKHLAFVILINGFIEPITKYRNLEDAICRYLIDLKL